VAVRTDKDARKVGYLVAALNLVTPPFFFLPAMAARQFLPATTDPNVVYGLLCRELLPVGMVGLLVAAMFSATLSTLSGDYNALSAVLTSDVWKRFVAPRASERALVWVGRLMTVVVGLLALAVAFVVLRSGGKKDLFDQMVTLFGIFLPPIAIPMLAGLMSRRASNLGALSALVAGVTVGLAAYFTREYAAPTTDLATWLKRLDVMTAATTLAALAGLIAGSWLRPGNAAAQQRTAEFLDRLRAPESATADGEEDTVPPSSSPLIVGGLLVVLLGALLAVAVLASALPAGAGVSLAVGVGLMAVGGALAALGRRQARRGSRQS